MCIIVDANNIGRVFDKKNIEHQEFAPVFDWIVSGKGKLVIGGSTFAKEIAKNRWFLNFLGQLSRKGKVINIPTLQVDILEAQIKKETGHNEDFDDQHIVSLLAISKCNVICSDDLRAFDYFKHHKRLNGHKPKIYTSSRNIDLLIDKNICNLCKPASKIRKEEAEFLKSITVNLR